MLNYELSYAEMRYVSPARRAMTSSDPKILSFKAAGDAEAVACANTLIKAPSDDQLVSQKIPIRLVRVEALKLS
jgi:hypothetical protein